MTKREKPARTEGELEALWRPSPEFIGPVAPPMLMWFYHGCPKDDWQIEAERRFAKGERRSDDRSQ
jgi:hypothetical protein